jgi:hypothetical protein
MMTQYSEKNKEELLEFLNSPNKPIIKDIDIRIIRNSHPNTLTRQLTLEDMQKWFEATEEEIKYIVYT